MPNIVEYTNRDNAIQPTEVGVEAFAQEGRRVGAFYHQLGQDIGGTVKGVGDDYVQQVTHQEISRQMATYAQGMAGLSAQWDQTVKSADPNDPTVAANFRANVLEPWMNQWKQGFSTKEGQQFADERIMALRQHMYERTAADMGTLAGEAAVANHANMVNGFSAAARMHPEDTDAILAAHDAAVPQIIDANPNLTPEAAAKLREPLSREGRSQIAEAGMLGGAEKNPNLTMALLKQGQYGEELSTSQVLKIQSYAESVSRAASEAQKAADAELRRQQKDDYNTAAKGLIAGLLNPDGSMSVKPQSFAQAVKIAQMPGADAAELKSTVDMLATTREHQINHTYVADNPGVFADFSRRMTIPAGSPGALTKTEIFHAAATDQLSTKSATLLADGLDHIANDPGTKLLYEHVNQSMTALKNVITRADPLTGSNLDPLGTSRYAEFMNNVHLRIQSAQAAGMSAPDIEKTLLDPHSPTYIGKEASFYAPTGDQAKAALKAWAGSGFTPGNPVNDPFISSSAHAKAGAPAGGTVSAAAWLAAHRAQANPGN